MQEANTAIGQAFNSVLEAEKVGANVSQLMVRLNTAGELLSEAQNAYNSDNSSNVTSIIEKTIQIAYQVRADAVNLSTDSLIKSQNNIIFTLSFSIVGAIVFGIVIFLIWRRFKHAHVMKVLGMKPEVIENTT